MNNQLLESYINELRFLIKLKKSVGIVNNRIHDKLAWIAIEKLSGLHRDITEFKYGGAGAGGIDIVGFDKDHTKKLIAEVKTTYTSKTVTLRGPQKQAIEHDFERLTNVPGNLKRYLVVVSEHTKEIIEKRIKPSEKYPLVNIIAGLDKELDENE